MSTRSATHRPQVRALRIVPAPADATPSLLSRAGRELTASLDTGEIGRALASLVVPELADACVLALVDGAGRPIPTHSGEASPPGLPGPCRLQLPLEAGGERFGTVTFTRAQGRRFGARDTALAQGVAEIATLALRNARRFAGARDAVRLRDEVLGAVAHDLRNPLMAIAMYTHLLQEAGLPPDQDAWTGIVLRSAERMNGLIQDLLDASALDEGRLRVHPAPIAVAPLLNEAAQLLERQADERGLQLAWHAAPGLPAVFADHDRVLQVLSNLLGNAVKFSPVGTEVELRAEPNGAEVLFTVRDRGRGIDAADLPHVFDRFWQADGSRGGTGLGLAIARGIIESHGGRIWVESTPGAGSTFSFTLPTTTESPAQAAEPPARTGGGERIRVLVVDDHPAVRRGLRELLRRRPEMLVVGEAATADEAVERTAELSPEVVLMDLNLPGSGLEATRRIARDHPAARVLILTAEPDDGCVRGALEAGARGYVRKSTDPAALVSAIRTVRGGTLVLDAGLHGWAAGAHAAAPAAPADPPSAEALRVLALEAAGYGTAEIAARLHVPRRSVHLHRGRGMRALGLSTRAELVRHALQEGWLGLDDGQGGCPADPASPG